MSFSDNDEFYLRRQPASSFLNKASLGPTQQQSSSVAMATDASKPCFKPTASSWPILLAVVPTVGSFFGGNADTWSDFVIILLVLYYIYKWMTLPWSYYESARSRRVIYQHASHLDDEDEDKSLKIKFQRRQRMIAAELRRHELAGLVWVVSSPIVAGYILQYSRHLLSNHERYMSSFNVIVFVLAASIKPVAHVMRLLRERTLYLQSEMQVTETQVQMLQRKLDLIEEELETLRKAFATKKDLGQVTDGLSPTIQQIAKTLRRFENKENALRRWSEDRFSAIEQKVQEFDQFVCYRIEQDQRHGMIVTMILLPLNITLWILKRMAPSLLGPSWMTPKPLKHHTDPTSPPENTKGQ